MSAQQQQPPEPFVTIREVAEFTSKPVSWVYDNAARLALPRYRIGRHWRFRLSEVADWMAKQ